MVIPRSRSAFSLSSTHAKRKEKKMSENSGKTSIVDRLREEIAIGDPNLGIDDIPYLKEPLPSSAASFSNFSMVRLSIPPHL